MYLIIAHDQLVIRVLDAPIFAYIVAYGEYERRPYSQGHFYKHHEVMINYKFNDTVKKLKRCQLVYKSFVDKLFRFDDGFHSFRNIDDAQKQLSTLTAHGTKDLILLKCIIPASTRYVEGSYDNAYKTLGRAKTILSEKLYFLKEITS